VSAQQETEMYRLIVTRRRGSELLCLADGPDYVLPDIEIPRWQRVADQVNRAVKERWNIEAYSLSTFYSDPSAENAPITGFQVMECIWSTDRPPAGGYWVPLTSLTDGAFRDPTSSRQIQDVLRRIVAPSACETRDPFAKFGWLADVCEWIQKQVSSSNLRLTGQFQQWTASATFSLIRFETDGSALWFKAVGEPNLHEFAIVSTLSELFPSFLPPLLASRSDWNAWLMTEAKGVSPDARSDFATWRTVSKRLAQLQMASLYKTDRLLAAGCRKITLESLLCCIDDFFAAMDELMKRQTKTSPPALSSIELAHLSGALKEVLATLDADGIPDALNHLDFNSGNILVSDDRCAFLDWAEAAVGHPFFTFEYLSEQFKRACPEDALQQVELISSYENEWRRLASATAIARSIVIAPLAAVFAYAASSGVWRDAARMAEPQTQAYFRSLTRRMRREADALQDRSLQCA
jgi:aminoglycoside phosphotransferase (APT) family kinase protein